MPIFGQLRRRWLDSRSMACPTPIWDKPTSYKFSVHEKYDAGHAELVQGPDFFFSVPEASDNTYFVPNADDIARDPIETREASTNHVHADLPDFRWKDSGIYQCFEDSGWHSAAMFAMDLACGTGRTRCGKPIFTLSEKRGRSFRQAFVENGEPVLDDSGSLTFGLLEHFYGTLHFDVTLSFSGSVLLSKTKSLSISVAPVNDPPTFSLSSETIVIENAYSERMFMLPGFVSQLL